MEFNTNYEFIPSGTCSKCGRGGRELLTARDRMRLLPGLCRECAPVWPPVLSRNDEVLRWHAAPDWEASRALKQYLEEGRGPLIWLECASLEHLNLLLQRNPTGDLDGRRSVMAFVHDPGPHDIASFSVIEAFLRQAFHRGTELHIVEKGDEFVDTRPYYNMAAANQPRDEETLEEFLGQSADEPPGQ